MGFGLLLIGYALAFAFKLSSVYFFADVLGGLMMSYACSKLSAYDRHFRPALVCTSVYSVAAIVGALRRFVFAASSEMFDHIFDASFAAMEVLIHFTLLFAIISITRDLDLKRITMKARRNLIFVIVYYTLQCFSLLLGDSLIALYPEFSSYLFRSVLLIQLAIAILNIILIGSCLKSIGEEGEDAPDPSPSKIKRFYKLWSDKEDKIYNSKKRLENIRNNKKTKGGKRK